MTNHRTTASEIKAADRLVVVDGTILSPVTDGILVEHVLEVDGELHLSVWGKTAMFGMMLVPETEVVVKR